MAAEGRDLDAAERSLSERERTAQAEGADADVFAELAAQRDVLAQMRSERAAPTEVLARMGRDLDVVETRSHRGAR